MPRSLAHARLSFVAILVLALVCACCLGGVFDAAGWAAGSAGADGGFISLHSVPSSAGMLAAGAMLRAPRSLAALPLVAAQVSARAALDAPVCVIPGAGISRQPFSLRLRL